MMLSRAIGLGVLLVCVSACSAKNMALNRMASALASATTVYEADNDPEFVQAETSWKKPPI